MISINIVISSKDVKSSGLKSLDYKRRIVQIMKPFLIE